MQTDKFPGFCSDQREKALNGTDMCLSLNLQRTVITSLLCIFQMISGITWKWDSKK